MLEPFKTGQKVYRVNQYYHHTIEEWTFIRKETEKQGGGFILYDEKDSYRTMWCLDEFTDDKEKVELVMYKKELERLNVEIQDWKNDIVEAEADLINFRDSIKECQKKLAGLNSKYEHLLEKYPEEFI